jgi:hypothetical protein
MSAKTITQSNNKDPKITKYLVIVAYVCVAFSFVEWLKKNGSIPKVYAVLNNTINNPNL